MFLHSRLEILSLDDTYEGVYSCECQYTGSIEPARIERTLRVLAEATIVYHMSSYNTDADVGDPVALQCAAEGIPTPFIFWQRTGGPSSIIRNYGLTKNVSIFIWDAVGVHRIRIIYFHCQFICSFSYRTNFEILI
ncbi:hypothetical protein FBUS_09161 [Fasciolopsis buskii]|uniref:Ig-like domain-containing protein n=1 Tax=Fasciolopsis buskii TaxID=27845 RepID=A0A8E0S4F2_9TREM|nr:hypothetical protein FBUS_09161 [Fasciolopsis buski]